jgi:hypothetical protein
MAQRLRATFERTKSCRARTVSEARRVVGGLALLAAVGCGSSPRVSSTDAGFDGGAPLDSGAGGDAGLVFDLGGDFSPSQNPNGVWHYGWTLATTLDPSQFQLDVQAIQVAAPNFWHPGESQYYPYVAANREGMTVTDSSDSWALRSHEIGMEASSSGQYSVVEFIAPATGAYEVSAAFEGVHFRISTTDVHVLQNSASLFAANIDGYGGDPAFHAIVGSSPDASYQGLVSLDAGDILSFAVGYGTDMTNSNDTTGVFVHIVGP